MTNEHDILFEVIDKILSEEIGGSPDADQAMKRIFIQPVTDVIDTAVGSGASVMNKTIKSGERFLARLWNTFVPDTLIPWFHASISKIDERERQYERILEDKFGEAFKRNNAALKAENDGFVFSLLYAPEVFLRAWIISKPISSAINMINLFSAGEKLSTTNRNARHKLFKKLNKLVESKNLHTLASLILEDSKEESASSIVRSPEMQELLRPLRGLQKDAQRTFQTFIQDMDAKLTGLTSLSSLKDVKSLTGLPDFKGEELTPEEEQTFVQGVQRTGKQKIIEQLTIKLKLFSYNTKMVDAIKALIQKHS